MNTRIVSIGEAMVELAPAPQAGLFQQAFAGDTLNTAWYLKQMQPERVVDYVTRVGTDAISDAMVAFLAEKNIGIDHVLRDQDRTVGLYMISLQDGERSFSYWRGQSAARQLATDASALHAACAGAGIVYFSGITLGILDEAGRETLLQTMRDIRDQGTVVAFDPNLRPRLWPDNDTMCRAIMEAAAVSDIALPSHDDEATFFGDADPAATLDRYAGAGAATVIVKNGDGPILHLHRGAQGTFTPAPVTRIVDTTAAGDSFNAGILAGFDPSADITPHVEAACSLAGKVIQSRGALVEL
ncbi:sugar kinase [uncultured Litoreibacter sp.]|uniref:sugar kinase n=1 Tax=uncultured Litoreibacter sp. TaxID=1392394 RepID=UPI00261CAE98|nr:sugar kinase [uncultured Litoreibacter sp.]